MKKLDLISPDSLPEDDIEQRIIAKVSDYDQDLFEKLYYIDYLIFSLPTRYYCARELFKSYIKETDEIIRRTYVVNIFLQLCLAIEDSIHVCTALRVVNKQKSKFHLEMAKKYKDSVKKETLSLIKNKALFPELGIRKKGNSYFKSQKVTQTVLKKHWKSSKDGFYGVHEVYHKYIEDYNKIKHGGVTVSSMNSLFDIDEEANKYVCALVCDNKEAYTIRVFSSLDTELIKKYVKDIQKISSHISTLILLFTTTHHKSDKAFMSELEACKDHINCYFEEI